jgi:hypothetical protein
MQAALPECTSKEVGLLQRTLHLARPDAVVMPTFGKICTRNKRNASLGPVQDKVSVKELVAQWEPSLRVARLYRAVYVADEINSEMLASLPPEFIVKASHGSTMTLLIRDGGRAASCHGYCGVDGIIFKKSPRWAWTGALAADEAARRTSLSNFLRLYCARFLEFDYATRHREAGYTHIRRACVFEEKLATANGLVPPDLKFFTLRRRPLMVMLQVGHLSETGKHGGTAPQSAAYYTTSGVPIPGAPGRGCIPGDAGRIDRQCRLWKEGGDIALPITNATLRRGVAIAARLAARVGLPQLRVDFFILSPTELAFAEFTPTTSSCGWNPTPITLDVLLARAALDPRDTFTSECIGAAARVAACTPSELSPRTTADAARRRSLCLHSRPSLFRAEWATYLA